MAREGSKALRELGYRLTPQRQLVWDALRKSGGHVSAEDVCARVQRTVPGFNIASVYRTLELLERVGMARTSHLGDGRRTYEVAEGPAGHHHLVCEKCHGTIHFGADPVSSLRESLERSYGYRFDDLELVIFGRCPRCQADGEGT
ncbi:MAG: Fur family transcriptional regulator [Chloroflexota bacterium]